MQSLTVLVVDNYPVVRNALASLLRARAGWTAEAASADEAWSEILAGRPSVVVLEMDLQGRSTGAELCRRIKAMDDGPRVLVFTGNGSPSAVVAAISAGADSFLHKSVGGSEFVDAVERTWFGQRLWILDEGKETKLDVSSIAAQGLPAMTRREEEVLSLVLRRYTNEEIAGELSLAPQTIKNQVSNTLRKLGVSGRRELFRKYSWQHGMTASRS